MMFVTWTEPVTVNSLGLPVMRQRSGCVVGYIYTGQPSAIVQIADFLRCVPLDRLTVIEDPRKLKEVTDEYE